MFEATKLGGHADLAISDHVRVALVCRLLDHSILVLKRSDEEA